MIYHILLIILTLIMIGLSIFYIPLVRLKNTSRVCPGYLNQEANSCFFNGSLKLPFSQLDTCDPVNYELYMKEISTFVIQLQLILEENNKISSISQDILKSWSTKIYPGFFYFAQKSLLTVLPNDFGQNYISPYGIPCFLNYYINCLSSKQTFCNDILKSPFSQKVCMEYLKKIGKTFGNNECPFYHKKINFPLYDELGMLGANSILPRQIMILEGIMPNESAKLYYWSFNIYLADRYTSKNKCNPYRNIYFTSIQTPFSIYQYPSEKDFTFAIIISICKEIGDFVYDKIVDKYDYVHRFNLPSGDKTMIINPNMINPNHLTNNDKVFDYETDRFTILFRMVCKDTNPIYQKFLKNPQFKFTCFEFENMESQTFYIDKIKWPLPLSPKFKEKENLKSQQTYLLNKINNYIQTKNPNLIKKNIHCFQSLAGLYAPTIKSFYDGTIQYENGLQAIQTASNANGDNYDAWYKFSVPQCLNRDDIFIALCVNHSAFNNSMYCSINIVDKNKSRGLISKEYYIEQDKKPWYVMLIGRDENKLNTVLTIIKKDDEIIKNCDVNIYIINTGPSIEWKIPICHQILFIERSYINPYILNEKNEMTFYKNVIKERWKEMTHPIGSELMDPIFIKYEFSYHTLFIIVFCMILIFILLFFLKI